MGAILKTRSKIWGPPPKNLGPKNVLFSARFQTTSHFDCEYLRNRTRYRYHHVHGVARSCFYQLWHLCSIRRSVPTDALHTLVHTFISSRIDYCNAVLYGATDTVIRRLQAVFHAAARLITAIMQNDHIKPTLRDTLHWLPMSQPITFKIALMTYDCIHGRSPVYFHDICSPIVSVPFRSQTAKNRTVL